jgi:hypothetical protein
VDDLDELRDAIDAFTARLRLDPVREFYSRAPDGRPPAEVADGYLRSAIARLHAVHVLLFDLGQVDRPPTGRVTAGSWVDQLAPRGAPQKIRAVIERYLRLHLDANLDRPQTVRHARDALRRLVTWMGEAHPEMASLADLHREHAEEFLRWLGTQTNQQTGAPLSIRLRCLRRRRHLPAVRPSHRRRRFLLQERPDLLVMSGFGRVSRCRVPDHAFRVGPRRLSRCGLRRLHCPSPARGDVRTGVFDLDDAAVWRGPDGRRRPRSGRAPHSERLAPDGHICRTPRGSGLTHVSGAVLNDAQWERIEC